VKATALAAAKRNLLAMVFLLSYMVSMNQNTLAKPCFRRLVAAEKSYADACGEGATECLKKRQFRSLSPWPICTLGLI
jgi:hypothetical protein